MATSTSPIYFISIFVCFLTYKGHCQAIKLAIQKQPLSEVLEQLRLDYALQFSANEALISNCKVSINSKFKSPEKAIDQLCLNCGLMYKNIGGVFVLFKAEESISTTKPKNKAKAKIYFYKGQVLDNKNKEPLPFSNVKIHTAHLVTDVNGHFLYQTKDSLVAISISHLGYYLYHNQIRPGSNHKIGLQTATTQLKEVVVQAPTRIKTINLGEEPGLIKLNHQVANYLPGTGNNSIFSLLRLQPGVMAAGEQTKDYMLWGSYKGQSQILFDGITIFNTSSFNEQVDAINPLVIKDIEILKGGYNVHIGDRVGGVVNITSHSGGVDSFCAAINLNNQALSYYNNIPLAKHSSLQIALRTTFPNLFDPETYQKDSTTSYYFGDLNVKYSIPFKNGDNFSISLIGNTDNYADKLSESSLEKEYFDAHRANKHQLGASMFYAKAWEKAGLTHIRTSYSLLHSSYGNKYAFEDELDPQNSILRHNNTLNTISEFSTRIDHFLPSTKHQHISFGIAIVYNNASFFQDTLDEKLIEQDIKSNHSAATRLNSYFKNKINLGKHFSIQPGIRVDLPLHRQTKPFWQPRIDAIIKPHQRWKINLAYGIYTQFINENTLVDDLGNYLYYWDVGDHSEPIQSMHYVAGFSCDYSFLTCNIEAYYKATSSLKTFSRKHHSKDIFFSEGENRSYGIDFYIKTEFKKQKIWFSYTWSKTEEQFENMNYFQRAPHDQRHEFKAAGIFNFSPFFVSVNYVYGSGFPSSDNLTSEQNVQAYSRLDLAVLYKFERPKLKIETGFSILNVLNTANIRYNNFSNFPDSTTKYNLATPFSPTIFVNINF